MLLCIPSLYQTTICGGQGTSLFKFVQTHTDITLMKSEGITSIETSPTYEKLGFILILIIPLNTARISREFHLPVFKSFNRSTMGKGAGFNKDILEHFG